MALETRQRRYQQSESGRIKQQEARQRYNAFELLSEYMGEDLTDWVEAQIEGRETKLATVSRLLQQLKDLKG
jgi:hypothetical protein